MIKRLQKRFIRIATLAVAAVLTVLCLAVNLANAVNVNAELREMLQTIAQNSGTLPQNPGARPNGKPDGQFTPETPFSTRYFVLRYTAQGTLTQADLGKIASVTKEDIDPYLALAVKHGAGFGYTNGYKYYVIAHGENRYMAIFLDIHQQRRAMLSLAAISALVTACCIGLVYLISVFCSRRAIEPMVKAAQKQTQFITDAGHELKTPITVIATSLKVLEMENGKQKWIDKAQAQTEKLTELVNALVTLSKLDEEESPLKKSPFCISDAAAETVDSFRDFADASGHMLLAEIESGISYNGDEYAIRQLLSILLDNAVKYAKDKTPILLTLSRAKHGAMLSVENECEALDPAETEKLFDRFYRSDKARSGSGFGIGLSIARSITQAHGGEIHAVCKGENRICFTASLH